MTSDKIEQLKREVCEVTHERDRKVAMQVIDHLHSRGLIVQLEDVEWLEEDLRMPVDSYNGAVLKAARLYLELLDKQKGWV